MTNEGSLLRRRGEGLNISRQSLLRNYFIKRDEVDSIKQSFNHLWSNYMLVIFVYKIGAFTIAE